MAVPKRAKKFRQKHLPKKLDNLKKSKKLADKYKKPASSNPRSSAAPAAPTRDFDVKPAELFDFSKEEKRNSDDEESGKPSAGLEDFISDDEKEAEDDERAYVKSNEALNVKLIKSWRKSLKKSGERLPEVLAGVSKHTESTDVELESQLIEILLVDVPKAVDEHYSPENAPTHALQRLLSSTIHPFLTSADGAVLIKATTAAKSVLRVCSIDREQKELTKALASIVVRMSSNDSSRLAAFDAMKSCRSADMVAKQAYKSLVRACVRTNSHTLPTINLAKNLFSTLFETESPAIYDVAFTEIRQLALHLKTALDRTKNAGYDLQVCYSWPFIHSLDFWSRVLSTSSNLRALVHPLCQVTLRTATLVPSQQYIPLRLLLVQSLIRISRHTHAYIPVCPILLDMVMDSSCLSKQAKPSTLQRPDLEALLHVPAMYVNTSIYQTSVVTAFVDVVVDALTLYAKHISFPELVYPVLVRVRKFARKSQVAAVSRPLLELCQRLEANLEYIVKARANVSFGPKDRPQVAKFLEDVDWKTLPLGKEAVARAVVREQQRKLREEENKNREETEMNDDDNNSSSDNDSEPELENEDENEVEMEEIEEDEEEDEME